MIVLLDKNIDTDIESIYFTNDGNFYDQCYWDVNENITITVDTVNFVLAIASSNIYVKFKTLKSLNLYLDQYKRSLKPRDLFTIGHYIDDPYYDLPKTGAIVSHEYTNTNIEQDFLSGRGH